MQLAIDGIQLCFTGDRNVLGWSSNWAKVHALVAKGYLSTESGGLSTYGHISYFPTASLLAEGETWTERDDSRYEMGA
jgi:hypothetical protein